MSDDNKPVISQVITWLSGQPFNNVLLIMIFTAMGWGMHYSVTVAIPAHLQQIQTGYRDVVEECQERHQAERESTIKTYDRWIEIIDRRSASAPPTKESVADAK